LISPDGRRLIAVRPGGTGREDAEVLVWHPDVPKISGDPVVIAGDRGTVSQVTVSPDSRWIMIASKDRDWSVRVWDLTAPDPGRSERTVLAGEKAIPELAFTPDSRALLAVVSSPDEKTEEIQVRRISVSYPATPNRTLVPRVRVERYSTRFSPDCRWLFAVGPDCIGRLWRIDDPGPAGAPVESPVLEPLTLHSSHRSFFSQDSRWLAVERSETTLLLWGLVPVDSARGPVVLRGHEQRIRDVTFGQDGSGRCRWLATMDDDRVPRLWDLTSEDPSLSAVVLPPLTKDEHRSAWFNFPRAFFSPGGRWLVTTDWYSLRLWHVGTPTLIDLARKGAGRALTTEERGSLSEILPMRSDSGADIREPYPATPP
jgi:WD40 repeat protein